MEINIDKNNNRSKKKKKKKLPSTEINNNEKELQKYIGENSCKILNNTLNNFISDEKFTNLNNNNIKNEIFYFTSFINSCKSYENISELKLDIKTFYKNKDENIEYHFHIIYNYLKQMLNLITKPEFFIQNDNIEQLINILLRIVKNIDFNLHNYKNNNIMSDIFNEFKLILKLSEKNIKNENKIEYIEYIEQIKYLIKDKIKEKDKDNIVKNMNNMNQNIMLKNNFKEKEKENKNLNNKIYMKDKNEQSIINIYETKIVFNKDKKMKVINMNTNKVKKYKNNYNYENIMFPPIQNTEENIYK